MNRISGILVQESTSQLQSFTSLQSKSGNAFKKMSPHRNVYFHADDSSQYATAAQADGTSKGRRHLIWAGAIHNRDEIVRFLNQSGTSSDPDTNDAQLALHLYNCVGHEVSRHLVGYYAFAIWDESTHRLFLSRDALGAECLYYFYTPNFFCWGTQIRQVCYLAGIEPSLNEEWVAEALTWSWDGCLTHTNDSPVQDVLSVPPGHHLVLKNKMSPQLTQWWEWGKYDGGNSEKDDVLIQKFQDLLTSSVKGCLGTDSRIIADLSGGLDSSSVVSLACHLAEEGKAPVHLRDVISYYEPNNAWFNDTEYQEPVVKRYGLRQHKFSLDGLWWFQGICDQDTYFDYPSAVLLCLNLVSSPKKFAADQGFVVSLSGAGGDNIVPPIYVYLFDYVRLGKFLSAWKDIIAISGVISRPFWKVISENILSPIKHWHSLWEPQIPEWIDQDFLQRTHLKDRFKDRMHDLRPDLLSNQFDTSVIRFGSDRPFTAGKYIDAPLGIDARHPFMDRSLINFTLQLPPHLKRQPREFKYILRQSMAGILPDTVRLRGGRNNFSDFFRKGLTNEADFFDEVRRNPVIAQLGFVDLKQWQTELTRYKLGLLGKWNFVRPPTYTDSALSVEVWLRTCLPQFHKAYEGIERNT